MILHDAEEWRNTDENALENNKNDAHVEPDSKATEEFETFILGLKFIS